MPTLKARVIEDVVYHVLHAAGASEEHARTVGQHLADANLTGHDSHGLIRLPQYVKAIDGGELHPKARPKIVKESSATALIDGQWTFGQVIAKFGTELAIDKARREGVAFVMMYHEGHTGRIGTYPEMAARAGMAAAMWDGVIGGFKANLAPFGGTTPKMGANPIAMAFPSDLEGPILLDFATSMCAEGKVRVARARGKRLPDKWVIGPDGEPSDDPNQFYAGGALLPMGGLSVGHKGYSLSFMVGLFGLLASMMSPEGFPQGNRWGTALMVLDISQFAPVADFKKQVGQAVHFVKDASPMKGFERVLYPGELEAGNRRERLANGVYVEDATWAEIMACVDRFGLRGKIDGIGQV